MKRLVLAALILAGCSRASLGAARARGHGPALDGECGRQCAGGRRLLPPDLPRRRGRSGRFRASAGELRLGGRTDPDRDLRQPDQRLAGRSGPALSVVRRGRPRPAPGRLPRRASRRGRAERRADGGRAPPADPPRLAAAAAARPPGGQLAVAAEPVRGAGRDDRPARGPRSNRGAAGGRPGITIHFASTPVSVPPASVPPAPSGDGR